MGLLPWSQETQCSCCCPPLPDRVCMVPVSPALDSEREASTSDWVGLGYALDARERTSLPPDGRWAASHKEGHLPNLGMRSKCVGTQKNKKVCYVYHSHHGFADEEQTDHSPAGLLSSWRTGLCLFSF